MVRRKCVLGARERRWPARSRRDGRAGCVDGAGCSRGDFCVLPGSVKLLAFGPMGEDLSSRMPQSRVIGQTVKQKTMPHRLLSPSPKGPFRSFKDYETTHFRFLGRRRRLEAYHVRWSLNRVISSERRPLPAPARMTPRGASRRIEDMVVALSLVSTLMDYAKDLGQYTRGLFSYHDCSSALTKGNDGVDFPRIQSEK